MSGGDVAVDVAGDADRGVAQDLRDHLEWDAVGEHGAGGRVPEGVEADVVEASLVGGSLEGAECVAGVAGLAEGRGEDVAGFVPLRARAVALDCLASTEPLEDLGRAVGNRQPRVETSLSSCWS